MKRISWLVVLTLALAAAFAMPAVAAVTITPATGGGAISADTAGAAPSVALTGPAIQENAAGEIEIGTIVLTAPSGFAFDTSPTVTATISPSTNVGNLAIAGNSSCSGGGALSASAAKTSTTLTIWVCAKSNAGAQASRGPGKITFTGIKVKSAAGAATTGNIANGGTAVISGATSSTNYGSLTSVPGALDHVAISPASATLAVGASQTFTGTPQDQYNNARSDSVTYSASASAGTINSSTGAFTAGTTTGTYSNAVTATAGTKSASANVTVTPGPLDHVTISPTAVTLQPGGAQTFSATARDQYNNLRSDAITFSATVASGSINASTGDFTATNTGGTYTNAVTASATAGVTRTASANVTVNPGSLDHIVISPPSTTITADDTQAYSAEAFDVHNNSRGPVTASTAFSISPSGTCTGAVCGSTTVGAYTVTGTYSGKSSNASLTVTAGALDHIVITPQSSTKTADETETYTTEAFDAHGNSRGSVAATYTIDGVPCGGSSCGSTTPGNHAVVASFGGKTDQASLDVTPGALDRIEISPENATITADDTQTYSSEGFDAHGNSRGPVAATYTIDGVPCGGSSCGSTTPDSHTVVASFGGKTDSTSLTVTPGALDRIEISPENATTTADDTQAYSSEAFDAHGNSRGPVAATYTIDGTPCGGSSCGSTAVGAHTVEASFGGKTDSTSLTVTPGSLDRIEISPENATITADDTQAYSSEGFDAHGNSRGPVAATYTIDGTPCGGSSCGSTAVGVHTVQASFGGKTDSTSLTVTPGALDRMEISPENATITADDTQTYSSEGFDVHGNSRGPVAATYTIDGTPCGGSSCGSTAVGVHTVQASFGGKTDSTSLTVVQGALSRIEISPEDATITADDSQLYSSEGFDAHGNSRGPVAATYTIDGTPCGGSSCGSTAVGVHTVQASFGGKTDSTSLTVNPGALDSIEISPDPATAAAGEDANFSAEAFDAYGNSRGDVTGDTEFSISPETGGAGCNDNACHATQAGSYTVTGAFGGEEDTAMLVVSPAALHHLVLSPADATIAAGGSVDYSAEGFDVFGNSRGDVTDATTFGVTPDGSCEANSCSASTSGDHTVTGTNGDATGTATLTVGFATAASVVADADPSTVNASPGDGNQSTISALVTDAYGNPVAGAEVSFAITQGNSGLNLDTPLQPTLSAVSATTNAAGVATVTYTAGFVPGDDEVTATVGSLSDTATVHVDPASCSIASTPLCSPVPGAHAAAPVRAPVAPAAPAPAAPTAPAPAPAVRGIALP